MLRWENDLYFQAIHSLLLLGFSESFHKIKCLIAFGKTKVTNPTHDLYTLMTAIFQNDNFKYTTTSQRRSFNSFSLFYIFHLIVFFFIISFQTLMHKEISRL